MTIETQTRQICWPWARGVVVVALAAIFTACAHTHRELPKDPHDVGELAGFPPEVRRVAEDGRSFDLEVRYATSQILRASNGGPVNILALSGGGAGAAFGAGALVGLSKSGTRPEFHLVTGVSAGALTAPFAFLGSSWDEKLSESFSGKETAKLIRFSLTGALFGSSLLRGKPLAQLVNRYATMEMLTAVAGEAAKGRMLAVATTDLDSQRTVLWDLGLIAMHGGDAGLKLFRQVLIASASVPGLFPPVMIPVEFSGAITDEMHVDGSVTASTFIAPEIASMLPDRLEALRGASVYVLSNGQYGGLRHAAPTRTFAIIRRALTAALRSSNRSAILAAFAIAKQNDMKFQVTAIPDDYPFRGLLDLKPLRMQALFDFGENCAAQSKLWTTLQGLLQRSLDAMPVPPGDVPTCPSSP